MPYLSRELLLTMGFRRLGEHVRISDKASIYSPEEIEIGDYSRIDDFCLISGRVVIGRNVHIAAYCNLAGGIAGIYLADFVGLAYGCHVFSQTDDYSGNTMTNPTIPSQYKHETKEPVYLERHTIVGTQSVIMPGVTLAEGTSVGAMSLIRQSTQPWSIYFGVPARRQKERSRKLLEHEAAFLHAGTSHD